MNKENNDFDDKLNKNETSLNKKKQEKFKEPFDENSKSNKNIDELIEEIILKLNKMKTSDINEINSLCKEVTEKINKFKTLLLQNINELSQIDINEILVKLLEFVTSLNSLKNQLTYLPFSPFNKIYVQNCIQPLMSIQIDLTSTATAYVGTARGLAFSTVVKRKTYKIRKYEKTTYKMMDLSNCINNILQKRIDRFIYMICD